MPAASHRRIQIPEYEEGGRGEDIETESKPEASPEPEENTSRERKTYGI